MPERTEVVLARLLSLVGWIGDHPGASIDETAAHFGRTRKALLRDIHTLGEVGDSLPGDSFELDWELLETHDSLAIRARAGVAMPPRLTRQEVTAILVGLRAIAPGLDNDLRARIPMTALAVAALAPEGGSAGLGLTVTPSAPADARMITVRDALDRHERLHFTYTDSRGVTTHRDVDPWNVSLSAEGWSLRGWCYRAEAPRTFRIDRMTDPESTCTPILTPAPPSERRTSPSALEPSPDAQYVTMTLTRQAQWVADELPVEVIAHSDDTLTVRLEVWKPEWVLGLLIDVSPHLISVDPPRWGQEMAARAAEALRVWDDTPIPEGGA